MAQHIVSLAQVEAALRNSGGLIATAARALGVSRQAIQQKTKKYPHLRAIVDDERELHVDLAESALKVALRGGEAWAVCFTLKTIGRQRGYVERQELTVRYEAERLATELGMPLDEVQAEVEAILAGRG